MSSSSGDDQRPGDDGSDDEAADAVRPTGVPDDEAARDEAQADDAAADDEAQADDAAADAAAEVVDFAGEADAAEDAPGWDD